MRALFYFIITCIQVHSYSQSYYEYEYKPEAFDNTPNQYLEYINGKGYLISNKDNSSIAIFLERTGKSQLVVELALIYSGDRIDFFPSESISITGLDKNYEKVVYRTYSFDEYLEEVNKKNRNKLAWASIGEAFSNYGAGNSSSEVYDTRGNKVGTIKTYDYDKARESHIRSENRLNRLEAEQNSAKDEIEHSIMKPTTLYNGDYLYGTIFLEIPREDKDSHAIHVLITIGVEKHDILFTSTN